MQIKPSEAVLVLDLDDTLYAEYDYKLSGIAAVIDVVCRLYPEIDREALSRHIRPESNAWLEDLCGFCGFNDAEKQSLLWQYRLHRPNVKTTMPLAELRALCAPFVATALISDGRSLTQRLKLEALGLLDLFDDILISEACGGDKPDPQRFVQIQQKYTDRVTQFIYVGDNLKKDFLAPNGLGWITVGIRPSKRNIHHHDAATFDAAHLPQHWVNALDELKAIFGA